jgi:hypothetical protein
MVFEATFLLTTKAIIDIATRQIINEIMYKSKALVLSVYFPEQERMRLAP